MQDRANTSAEDVSDAYIQDLDSQTVMVYTYVVYNVVCQAIAVFGIVTNVINIICFAKQGFKESVNVSLLGLAVSDLGSLISLTFINICLMPVVATADLPFDVMGVYYLTIVMPHLTFNRVSTWTTALITLERCLCIIAPLQIKILITPKRMFIIIVCTYIILMFTGADIYSVNRLDMIFSPWRNKTILGLVSTVDKENVEKISLAINSFFLPFAAFAVIIVCTTLLVFSLRRRTSAATIQSDVNSRNMRVAKMVVMISVLFIFCFIPMSVVVLVTALEPAFNIHGK